MFNLRLRLALMIPVVLTCSERLSVAATYYVANQGNDSNPGTSPSMAWRTLSHVNMTVLNPGDIVLLKKGDAWRDLFVPQYSGTSAAPITYGSWGSGPRPIIDGTDVLTGTRLISGTTYSYSVAHAANQLFVNQQRLSRHRGVGSSVGIGEWDQMGSVVYVNTGASAVGQLVEIGARQNNVYIVGASYITIDGLDLEKSDSYGVGAYGGAHDLTVKNSKISYAWASNIDSGDQNFIQSNPTIINNDISFAGGMGVDLSRGCNGGLIAGNDVHENGAVTYGPGSPIEQLYNAGIKIWGNKTDMQNVVIKNNRVWGNGRSGQTYNGGIGIWVDESMLGNVVTTNLVHDNATAGIVIEATSGATVSYNTVYSNNLIDGAAGIELARYGSGNQVYHNTSNSNIVGIAVEGTTGQGAGVFVNDSIHDNIAVNNSSRQLRAILGGDNTLGSSGNTYIHNAFGIAAPGFIEWGQNSLKSTYSDWESAYGQSTNSIQADPLAGNPGGMMFTIHVATDY
jgi:parallel beta-helix repeat protein